MTTLPPGGAFDFMRCAWGRALFMDSDATPCAAQATQQVVLHDPIDMGLSTTVFRVCDEHLAAIAQESTPTTPERTAEWNELYGKDLI